MQQRHTVTPPHGVCVSASLLGLLLWAILSAVSAARPLRYTLPTFLDTPVNITAYRGTDVELPCAVHNLGPKSIVWKKQNQVNPITINDYVFDPDPSYEIQRPPPHDPTEWNLRITDVQMRHAGTYECQISTKEDFTRNITLTVIDKPNYPIYPRNDGISRTQPDGTGDLAGYQGIQLEGDAFVEKGMPIVLNCTATAIDYRPKGVDWFKDGSKIKSDSHVQITESSDNNVLYSTLEIPRSNMSDAGTYVCRSSKYNVKHKKIIVLNTGTSNQRRNSNGEDDFRGPYQPNPSDRAHRHSGSPSLHSHRTGLAASSSVLLLYALLCWPLLRATVRYATGQ